MKGWLLKVGILTVSCLIGSSIASAGTRCEVNWKAAVYIAEGEAVVQNPKLRESREKALSDARKLAVGNMMALIQKTSVSGKNPAQILAKNPVAKRKIINVVNTSKPVTSCVVTNRRKTTALVGLKIPVFGPNGPGSVIVGAAGKTSTAPGSSASALDDSHSSIMRSSVASKPPSADNTASGYTSLILDASSFNVQRSKCPRVLKPSNEVVWEGENAAIDQVEEFGIAAYSKSIEAANRNPRCGLRPLIVRVQGVAGIRNWDLIVSESDARLILDENRKNGYLEKLNVIVVID